SAAGSAGCLEVQRAAQDDAGRVQRPVAQAPHARDRRAQQTADEACRARRRAEAVSRRPARAVTRRPARRSAVAPRPVPRDAHPRTRRTTARPTRYATTPASTHGPTTSTGSSTWCRTSVRPDRERTGPRPGSARTPLWVTG